MPAPTPQSKATMDPNYEKQLRKRKTDARAEYEGKKAGGRAKWDRPVGWSGDPFDLEGLHTPHSRDQANENLVDAMKDAAAPGTTGDVVACSTMINRLSTMERAFKVRHTLRRVRATAHVLGRKKGHGDDRGPYIQLGVEYVRELLRQAKKPQ